MARKNKYQDEKDRLDSVRKRLEEEISNTLDMQRSLAGNDDYKQALIYQEFAKVLREIKVVCGMDTLCWKPKSKEVAV